MPRRYRLRHKGTGEYLVAPIDAWGKDTPAWTPIPEAAATFTKADAEQQRNRLWWDARLIPAEITTSLKMKG